jgi:hypothetical protein
MDTSTPTATSAAKRATERVIVRIADGIIKELQGRTRNQHSRKNLCLQHDDNQHTQDQEHCRIEELRQQLQIAEMEMALRKKSATMHGIAAPGEVNPTTVQLGPAVYSEVEFEGCHVKALVDTGSPATIVSLDCVLSALAKGRPKSQTPSEWERVVKQTLKPPEVTLRSNGGGGLDIIAQLSEKRRQHSILS